MHGNNVFNLHKTNGIHSEKNMLLDIEPKPNTFYI